MLKLSLSLTNPPRRVPIEIASGCCAKKLFQVASEATKIPLDNLKLIFRGRIISNSNDDEGNVVDEFKLEDGSVIHCMGKPVETAAMPAPAEPASAAAEINVESSTAAKTNPPPCPLKTSLGRIKSHHSASEYKTALDTLTKLLSNVIQNPMEEKYRKVKKSNAVFHKRLGRLTGGTEILLAIGFRAVAGEADADNGEEYYVLTPSPDAWPKLLQSKETIDEAVRNHEMEQQQQQRQPQHFGNPTLPGNAFQSGMNPMNFQSGMGMGAGVDPSVMSNILSNPNALRDMLQNPAMQQMMQSHPYFANNPMMMEQMRLMANNPQMINQISRMMSDPNHLSRLNDMMRGMQMQGGSNGLGFGGDGGAGNLNMNQQMELMRQMANLSRGGVSSTNSNSGSSSVGGVGTGTSSVNIQQRSNENPSTSSGTRSNNRNDSEMTEEEMIEEAIARSLREQ
jgi:PUB domain.